MKASGANVLLDASSPKFAAQAIRKVFDIDWKPTHFLALTGQSIPAALVPAGVEKAVGIISASGNKDPSDATWVNDKGVQDYVAFMKTYFPAGARAIFSRPADTGPAQGIVYLLKQCGDTLTRENVMYQATHMHNVEFPLLLPGIEVINQPN